jgi:hypothetical protein
MKIMKLVRRDANIEKTITDRIKYMNDQPLAFMAYISLSAENRLNTTTADIRTLIGTVIAKKAGEI